MPWLMPDEMITEHIYLANPEPPLVLMAFALFYAPVRLTTALGAWLWSVFT